jgi:hypothetical protein
MTTPGRIRTGQPARPGRRAIRLARAATTAVVAVVSLVSMGGGLATAAGPKDSPADVPAAWLIADSSVQMLVAAGLPRPTMLRLFNNPATLLIVQPGKSDPSLPNASLVELFTSFTSLQQAFAAGTVPANVHTLLLDLEQWSLTPANEQANPFDFAAQAQTLAHQHGRQLIFAPAVNLVSTFSGNPPPHTGSKTDQYINLNMAKRGAAVSDYFEIQAQQTEATTVAPTFAPKALVQAHNAYPTTPVLVGLSTNPSGRTVTASDLTQLYSETEPNALGFWLNVPGHSQFCPSCGAPQPQVAVKFLESLPPS